MKHLLILLALAALALVGCRAGSAPPASLPTVKILAYINVTSGCQQETVDLLKAMAQKEPRVELEFVDFGDGGPGSERWEKSGHKCMTIEVNGSPTVKYPKDGKMRAVGFMQPAGFIWNHPDLEEAVAAGLEGKLQPATEEEVIEQVGGIPVPPKPGEGPRQK